MIGFRPEQREIVREPDQIALPVINFHLARLAQQIAPVRVTVERQRPSTSDAFESSIGATGTNSFVSLGGFASGDPMGSIAAALATLPGVMLIPDGSGGPPIISAFGLAADQNAIMLNGMNLNGITPPRDGSFAQVSVTSFDPGRSFGGLQVNFFTGSGSNYRRRSVHATFESPSLQWNDPAAARLGGVWTRGILSGTLSGPVVEDKAYYNVSYQLQRQTSDLALLTATSAASLQALGLSADSVARLVELASTFGIPQ